MKLNIDTTTSGASVPEHPLLVLAHCIATANLPRPRKNKRRAAVLVTVLVCLFIVSALAVSFMQTLVTEYRQNQRRQQQVQSVWLAQSALSRAQAMLLESDAYRGELWQVPAGQLKTSSDGIAKIQIQSVEGAANQRRVLIEARYPNDPKFGILTTKKVLVTIPTKQPEIKP